MREYAISTWIVEHLPTEQAIEHLASSGFKAVELSGGVSPLLMDWEADAAGTRRKLAAAGLDVPSIHCPRPGRHLDIEDDGERRASAQANVEYFHWMKECGIPEIVIHPSSGVDVSTPEARVAARGRAVESLKALADEAGHIGVRMAVENLGRDGRPGSTMGGLVDMIHGLGDHVGLCHDVGHSAQADLDVLAEMKAALATGKLLSLHLHDVKTDRVDHFMPGEGRLGLEALVDELDASGFAGLRTLEVRPPETDVAARLGQAAAVREAWAARPRAGGPT